MPDKTGGRRNEPLERCIDLKKEDIGDEPIDGSIDARMACSISTAFNSYASCEPSSNYEASNPATSRLASAPGCAVVRQPSFLNSLDFGLFSLLGAELSRKVAKRTRFEKFRF